MVSPSAAHVDISAVHEAAAYNDLEGLHDLATENKGVLFSNDRNGTYTPCVGNIVGSFDKLL